MMPASAVPPYGPPRPILPPEDERQLDLLSTLFYCYAAFVGLSAIVCVGGVLVGVAVMPLVARGGRPPPELALFGAAFALIFGAAALLLVVKTVVMILTGRAFKRRTGHTLCWVGACFALMTIPLGTALGIFAIVTLQKPGVRRRLTGEG